MNLELWFRASGETNGSEQVDVRGWQLKRSRSEISNRKGVSKKNKKTQQKTSCGVIVFGCTLVSVRQRRHVQGIGEERMPQA